MGSKQIRASVKLDTPHSVRVLKLWFTASRRGARGGKKISGRHAAAMRLLQNGVRSLCVYKRGFDSVGAQYH